MKIKSVIFFISLDILGCLTMTSVAETVATTTDTIPNLTGLWTASITGHAKEEGFIENTITINIT